MAGIIEEIPTALAKKLSEVLSEGEEVRCKIRGAMSQALICTDRRVLIIKSGLNTGNFLGTNVFQIPYGNISSVEVKFNVLTGYFELSAGGIQNMPKSYWSTDKATDPAKAPNCISIGNRAMAARFQEACTFILEMADLARRPAPSQTPVSADQGETAAAIVERLWRLHTDGAISKAEFDALKRDTLAKIGS